MKMLSFAITALIAMASLTLTDSADAKGKPSGSHSMGGHVHNARVGGSYHSQHQMHSHNHYRSHHATHFHSHYRGHSHYRHYRNWSRYCWLSQYRCYGCYCPTQCCWYYYYAPGECYLPMSYLPTYAPVGNGADIINGNNPGANLNVNGPNLPPSTSPIQGTDSPVSDPQ